METTRAKFPWRMGNGVNSFHHWNAFARGFGGGETIEMSAHFPIAFRFRDARNVWGVCWRPLRKRLSLGIGGDCEVDFFLTGCKRGGKGGRGWESKKIKKKKNIIMIFSIDYAIGNRWSNAMPVSRWWWRSFVGSGKLRDECYGWELWIQ